MSLGVLDVSNVEGSGVLLDGLEDSNSSNVVSSGEHDGGSVLELDDTADLVGLEINLLINRVWRIII